MSVQGPEAATRDRHAYGVRTLSSAVRRASTYGSQKYRNGIVSRPPPLATVPADRRPKATRIPTLVSRWIAKVLVRHRRRRPRARRVEGVKPWNEDDERGFDPEQP
jgi:hypothetical protein